MSNIVAQNQHINYIDQNLQLIQNQNSLSSDDLKNFVIQCKRTGLDPITRQIYAIPNNGKMTIMASIDGLRLIADRSGLYEGQTQPQWCGEDGKWVDVWLKKELPKACKVGVHKKNFKEALIAIAIFDEYAGRHLWDDNRNNPPKHKKGDLTFMWAKMPALMIAKVAEALALRKAFPNEMSGIYSTEEMDQAQQAPQEKTAQNVKLSTPQVDTNKAHNQYQDPPKFDTTEKIDDILNESGSFESYVINAGPKSRLTGTKLKDHTPKFLLSTVESSEKWHKENNKTPHKNTQEFISTVYAYLKSINEIPF